MLQPQPANVSNYDSMIRLFFSLNLNLTRTLPLRTTFFSNYDTDAFLKIFKRIHEVAGPNIKEYGGEEKGEVDIAYRVLADHARCLTFALSEGLLPSNEGRGYVLRRILRRALRYGKEVIGADLSQSTFLAQICDSVINEFGDVFTDLETNRGFIRTTIMEEEKVRR